jgi:NADPH:quinone reductase-like Zn-dependent oxidoreductase
MKAALLRGYGDVNQIQVEEVPQPAPGPGEVLVRVIATSVNPIDYKIRSGAFKDVRPLDLPVVLGRDVAGEVVALGPGVSNFKAGDKVMGLVEHSYAEYLTAPAKDLTAIPEGLDPQVAGVLPLILLTGAQLMEKGVQPRSGELVLVTGAAGSVGRTAAFVAKQHGANVIAGVRAKQRDEAKTIAADSIAAIDGDAEIAGLPELDAIADTVNGGTIAKLVPKLKRTGRLGSVLGKPDAALRAGLEVRDIYSQADPERLHQLAEEVRDGKLIIPIAKRLPLSEIRQAQSMAEKDGHGKVAILP